MANYKIRLRRSGMEGYREANIIGFRVIIEVIEHENIPPEIFVFRRQPADPVSESYRDMFVCVASPTDILSINAGEPASGEQYYRASRIDAIVRTQDLADKLWDLVVNDVELLVKTYKTFEDMQEEDSIEIAVGTA